MSEPESYEERLRESFEQIQALANDALSMLDAQREGSPIVPPDETTWVLGQIAAQVIAAEAIIAEWDVSDDEADDD